MVTKVRTAGKTMTGSLSNALKLLLQSDNKGLLFNTCALERKSVKYISAKNSTSIL